MSSIDPIRIYQVANQVCTLTNKFSSLGVSANNSIIAGVTGKRIRVMGLTAQSDTAVQGRLQLMDGSGGTNLYYYLEPPNTGIPNKHPITDSGYFETSTGVGLFATITAAGVGFNIFYIIYTPS